VFIAPLHLFVGKVDDGSLKSDVFNPNHVSFEGVVNLKQHVDELGGVEAVSFGVTHIPVFRLINGNDDDSGVVSGVCLGDGWVNKREVV